MIHVDDWAADTRDAIIMVHSAAMLNHTWAQYASTSFLDVPSFSQQVWLPPHMTDQEATALLKTHAQSKRQLLVFDKRKRASAFSVLGALNAPALLVYPINGLPERLLDMQQMLDVVNRPFLNQTGLQLLLRGMRLPEVTSVACESAVCFVTVGECPLQPSFAQPELDAFRTAAAAAGTDKVPATGAPSNAGHRYHTLYSPLLAPLQRAPISLLEIGLGCAGSGSGAGTSVGRSAELWVSYFSNVHAQLAILEFMKGCVHEWRASALAAARSGREVGGKQPPAGAFGFSARARAAGSPQQHAGVSPEVGKSVQSGRLQLFVGSQSDPTVLATLSEPPRAPYDVVIDDGGHENQLMLPSFHALWPHVAVGGLYFIEDMQTAYRYRDRKPLFAPGTSIQQYSAIQK